MHGRWAPRREASGRPKDGEQTPTPTPSSYTHIPRVSPPQPLSSTWQRTFWSLPSPRGQTGVWAPRPHQGDDIPEGSASHICFFISVSLACFLPQGTRSLKSCGATLPQHLPPQLVVGGGAWGGWGRLHLVLLLQAWVPCPHGAHPKPSSSLPPPLTRSSSIADSLRRAPPAPSPPRPGPLSDWPHGRVCSPCRHAQPPAHPHRGHGRAH